MEKTKASESPNTTVVGELSHQSDEHLDPFKDKIVSEDAKKLTHASGDECNSEPFQSTRPDISGELERLNISFDEGLKLNCSMVGETNKCSQKARLRVRKDLFYPVTADNSLSLEPKPRDNIDLNRLDCIPSTAESECLEPKPDDVDYDEGIRCAVHTLSGDNTDADGDEFISTGLLADLSNPLPKAESLATKNHNILDEDTDRQLAKPIHMKNKFTQQRRYKHTYFDSDGKVGALDSPLKIADKINLSRRVKVDKTKKFDFSGPGNNFIAEATHQDRPYFLPQASGSGKNFIAVATHQDRPYFLPQASTISKPNNDIPAYSDRPKRYVNGRLRNKHTYFDSDGNEILFSDSQTTNEKLSETSGTVDKNAEIHSIKEKLAGPIEAQKGPHSTTPEKENICSIEGALKE